ncbi:MAG: hypothetical protein LUB61_06225 [Eggerthellaceae bacterium]|nr:hypothetical protein [Eggerthellaceae bacterium]
MMSVEEALPYIPPYTPYMVLDSGCVIFTPMSGKDRPEVRLSYDKITRCEQITETEMTQKNKSSVGRAAVGGLLLGPLGAVVGAASGVGIKNSRQIHEYFVNNSNFPRP